MMPTHMLDLPVHCRFLDIGLTHASKTLRIKDMIFAVLRKTLKLSIVQLLRIGGAFPPDVEVNQQSSVSQRIDDLGFLRFVFFEPNKSKNELQ